VLGFEVSHAPCQGRQEAAGNGRLMVNEVEEALAGKADRPQIGVSRNARCSDRPIEQTQLAEEVASRQSDIRGAGAGYGRVPSQEDVERLGTESLTDDDLSGRDARDLRLGGDTAEVTLAELREQGDVSKEVCPLLRLGRPQVQIRGPGFGKRLLEDTPADLRRVPALPDHRGLVKRIIGRTHKPLLSQAKTSHGGCAVHLSLTPVSPCVRLRPMVVA
jgi:hypothetical protein